MSDLPTPVEVVSTTRQVQDLSTEAKETLLYALVGRMLLLDRDALAFDIQDAKRIEMAL